jgi:energy-coupling factor transporter ATP-binding protein EcfA2
MPSLKKPKLNHDVDSFTMNPDTSDENEKVLDSPIRRLVKNQDVSDCGEGEYGPLKRICVLVVGITGSGKTTLVQACAGVPRDEWPRMNNKMASDTKKPAVVDGANLFQNFQFVDTQGMLDTRQGLKPSRNGVGNTSFQEQAFVADQRNLKCLVSTLQETSKIFRNCVICVDGMSSRVSHDQLFALSLLKQLVNSGQSNARCDEKMRKNIILAVRGRVDPTEIFNFEAFYRDYFDCVTVKFVYLALLKEKDNGDYDEFAKNTSLLEFQRALLESPVNIHSERLGSVDIGQSAAEILKKELNTLEEEIIQAEATAAASGDRQKVKETQRKIKEVMKDITYFTSHKFVLKCNALLPNSKRCSRQADTCKINHTYDEKKRNEEVDLEAKCERFLKHVISLLL